MPDGHFEAAMARLSADIQNDEVEEAWDCNPEFEPDYGHEYDDLDDCDDSSNQAWQVQCLDRFGDRLVNGAY